MVAHRSCNGAPLPIYKWERDFLSRIDHHLRIGVNIVYPCSYFTFTQIGEGVAVLIHRPIEFIRDRGHAHRLCLSGLYRDELRHLGHLIFLVINGAVVGQSKFVAPKGEIRYGRNELPVFLVHVILSYPYNLQ
jgi:hypothetical protein